MTSDPAPRSNGFVWIWLPGALEPVIAGQLVRRDEGVRFNYGQSYLKRPDALPIYLPELPLTAGLQPLLPGLTIASSIRDAAPDAWGRRVILNRKFGARRKDLDKLELDELTFLLESGSDRIGALDFQNSAVDYVPRISEATLTELMASARKVEENVPLSPELDQALHHGSSIGGARPKALLTDDNRKLIAKFSSSGDTYSVVQAEFVAMRLAALAGLDVAPVGVVSLAGRDALLIERFDRNAVGNGWARKAMVSALTIAGLDEMMARYASYEDLAQTIRQRFTNPTSTLRELFARIAFNILTGNTDDHARNHAAFWDGSQLTLTPAYDICPQPRSGQEATQAMLIVGEDRSSRIETVLRAAANFHLSESDAIALIISQIDTITNHWHDVCAEAQMGEVDRNLLWRRQFLNPYAFTGLRASAAGIAAKEPG